MDGSSSDDKRHMAPPEDERPQVPDLGDKQSGHMMTDHHGRRVSKSASRSKSDSSSSKGKSKHVEYDHRRPSIPYSEEPISIDQSLQEQLQAKIQACNRLESINQGLKNDLLKHLSDPYTKHKCSDGEIEDRYDHLLHGVEQTARKLCEKMDYDKEALIEAVRFTSTQEGKEGKKDKGHFKNAVFFLEHGYRGKFFQKSVAEMLLFRALLRFALPPGVFSIGLERKENEAGEVLFTAMMKKAVSGATHDAGRLSWLEKWRLDAVLYVTQHESAEKNIALNKTKMLSELSQAFRTAGDSSVALKDLIDMGFDFGQLLQTQKSIYYFSDLIGKFDPEKMDFQDPQQEEYLSHGGGTGPQDVMICFYPAFFKKTSFETLRIVMSKGKALYKPWDYD